MLNHIIKLTMLLFLLGLSACDLGDDGSKPGSGGPSLPEPNDPNAILVMQLENASESEYENIIDKAIKDLEKNVLFKQLKAQDKTSGKSPLHYLASKNNFKTATLESILNLDSDLGLKF